MHDGLRAYGAGVGAPSSLAAAAQQMQAQTSKPAPMVEVAGKRAAETVHALDAVIERLATLADRLLGTPPSPPTSGGNMLEKEPQAGALALVMHMLDAQQSRVGAILHLLERLEQL